MKNEIEELNLTYGVSIYNTMLKYEDFITSSKKKRKDLYSYINNFFLNLEKVKNVDSNTVVKIGLVLLENKEIREKILNNEIDKSYLDSVILNEKDIKTIIESILNNSESEIYIPYIENDTMKKRNFYEQIDKIIYENRLIYSDLIQLIMMNYSFPKKISIMNFYNYYLSFVNNINIMFYHLNYLLNGKGNREDIYYCGLLVLNHKYSKELLFPNTFSFNFNYSYKSKDIKAKIYSLISRTLHFFNRFYYIALPKYEYENIGNNLLKSSNVDKNDEIIEFIVKDLNIKQITFLFKIGSELDAVTKNYLMNDYEKEEMEDIISTFKINKEIKVIPQSTNDKYKKLIEKNVIGVQDYCQKNNIILNNFVYCPDFSPSNARLFIEFSITMNNFEYKFSLRKFNNVFAWNLKLPNKKSYKIKLYLEDDYKHILQAMFEDVEENTRKNS